MITLGSFPTKKEYNLRVLKRVFSPHVMDYTVSFTESSVYSFSHLKNEWDKLQVFGALFILRLSGIENPFVFVLNRGSYIDPKDFHLEIPPTAQIFINDTQIFIKLERNVQYCIVVRDNETAEKFTDNIREFWKGERNSECVSDPTFRRALKNVKQNSPK